jgi:hypothetical protein
MTTSASFPKLVSQLVGQLNLNSTLDIFRALILDRASKLEFEA